MSDVEASVAVLILSTIRTPETIRVSQVRGEHDAR